MSPSSRSAAIRSREISRPNISEISPRVTGWNIATAISTPASSFVSCFASAGMSKATRTAGPNAARVWSAKPLPCPDELDRPPAKIFAQVVEEEVEDAIASDHPCENLASHRLRRSEQHRLDARLPFPPAQFRRQVGELAVEVELRSSPSAP